MTRDDDVENGRWPEYAERNPGSDQSPPDPGEKAGQTQRASEEHAGAPPCIQRMFCLCIPEDRRDESLLHIGVYLRNAFPDDWSERLFTINYEKCDPPLKASEVANIIRSLELKQYQYNCNAFQDICDEPTCLNREFGIEVSQQNYVDADITRIQKIDGNPPVWILTVNGQPVRVSTRALKSHEAFRTAVLEQRNQLIRPVRKRTWEKLIANLLQTLEVVEAPAKFPAPDQVWQMFLAWISRDVTVGKAMKCIRDGYPFFNEEENLLLFRGSDFLAHLRKEHRRIDARIVWRTLRNKGAKAERRRVLGKQGRFWKLRVADPWFPLLTRNYAG
jgi:hypothetical protein